MSIEEEAVVVNEHVSSTEPTTTKTQLSTVCEEDSPVVGMKRTLAEALKAEEDSTAGTYPKQKESELKPDISTKGDMEGNGKSACKNCNCSDETISSKSDAVDKNGDKKEESADTKVEELAEKKVKLDNGETQEASENEKENDKNEEIKETENVEDPVAKQESAVDEDQLSAKLNVSVESEETDAKSTDKIA